MGEKRRVTGVDVTAEQLATTRKHSDSFCKSLGYKACNLEFVEGYIEKVQILKRPISGDLI